MPMRAFFMKDLEALKQYLNIPRKIVITTHANPDADALGSSMGLYYFLKSFSHQIDVIIPNDYPDFIAWMVNEDVLVYENQTEKCDQILDEAELLFCLDFSGYNRIKTMTEKAASLNTKVALIDHHLNPEIKPDFNFWDVNAAATAELVYDLIVAFKGLFAIDQHIAAFLYAGIMTDTGSFRHNNTTSKVHRTVAELIDRGVDVNTISRLIYDTNSINRVRFLGFALSQKLTLIEEFHIAYFVIKATDFEQYDLKQGDTEGFVNYALSIKGIKIAAIIIQRADEIKLSFRSVGEIAVNTFAEQHFNGGGHRNAAGGSSDLTLEETIIKFKSLVQQNILKTK